MTDLPILPPTPRSAEALFRFQVVCQVRTRTLAGQKLADAVRAVAAIAHLHVPDAGPRLVSGRSLYRWVAAFDASGVAGLEPVVRRPAEASRVLAGPLLAFVRAEKDLDPRASVPELLRRARLRGIVADDAAVDRVTLWRACTRQGLAMRRADLQRQADVRRFAYPHRMMMMLADGKHFRAGPRLTRRVALFFLDDATRRVLDVVVGTSETTGLFLRGLFLVVRRWGLMDVVFLDNGPGFASDDTRAVVAALPSLLVLGTAGYPEGHGKIERFNRSADDDLLRSLAGAPDVDDDCAALELRLRHYVHRQYGLHPHESLDGRTPAACWDADERPLRFPASEELLRSKFVATELRTVSGDNVLSFDGTAWEVPRGHAGKRVRVHRQLLDDALFVLHDGRFVRLHPVDLAGNAVDRRAPRQAPAAAQPAPGEPDGPAPARSAATLAFDRDFGPVVGPDGGFAATTDEEETT